MVGQEEAAVDAGAVGELQVGGVEGDQVRFDPVGQFAEDGQDVGGVTGQAKIFQGEVSCSHRAPVVEWRFQSERDTAIIGAMAGEGKRSQSKTPLRDAVAHRQGDAARRGLPASRSGNRFRR